MFISKILIQGYRSYKNAEIPFHDGINMIIGANNSGKSNLLKAISLALNNTYHITIDDMFCETDVTILKAHSPIIKISLVVSQSEEEPDTSEEIGLLGGCIVKFNKPYQALINFQFSLSSEQEENYIQDVKSLENHQEIWNVIRNEYSRFYDSFRWGGNRAASKENLNKLFEKCDFQFLDALRDVGRNMFMGYNPMLRDVLNFFIDYDIKMSKDKEEDQIKEELRSNQKAFKEQAKPLMKFLLDRLESGKKILLDYANDTGASFGNVEPDFQGILSESELLAVLKLIIRHETGVEIPAANNGLGYNNLIYMSLLLAKMQASADGNYMKRQAKLYSLLAIEEPEAHLHPAMQYQFLNFLNSNRSKHNVNQIIVTTHSPEIVSAVSLDCLISLNYEGYGSHGIGYPRTKYSNSDDDIASKAYVQRFLDATRSDMFFAEKLIFVEGIAEKLLIPTFAKYLGYDLVKDHVLIVNMGGRYFHHFLKMFDNNGYNISKKVACITDTDPCSEGEACYPFEYGIYPNIKYSCNAEAELQKYSSHPTIRYFRQDISIGKTLEYDMAFANSRCKLIVVAEMNNADELKDLMDLSTLEQMKERLRDSKKNTALKEALDLNTSWDNDQKMKGLIAARYLNSVSKGENALALSVALEENYYKENSDPTKEEFVVPQYIIDALQWLLQ